MTTSLNLDYKLHDHAEGIEQQRLDLQTTLDQQKSQEQRNRLGQFATPTALARDMLAYGLALLPPDTPVRFLDPAIGTGAFYSALIATTTDSRIIQAQGFEIDEHYEAPARRLWIDTPLNITQADFTAQIPPVDEGAKYNLLICNPPYVRHHHLVNTEKVRLQEGTRAIFGRRIDGLAGLYCYFLGLAHAWMRQGAVAGWLIPSEFMDVNYGRAVKGYLLNQVTLLHIHRFDPQDVQFEDALVSSAVVFFRNERPASSHEVTFSYGGTLPAPTYVKQLHVEDLRREAKWTRFPTAEVRARLNGPTLGDYFRIKRGVATGDNSFFIFTPQRIEALGLPWECFRPILPSPRYLEAEEIFADEQGHPILDRLLFLLDCRLAESVIQTTYPALWTYLQTGKPKVSERYLCSKRMPWYSQEERTPTPFMCTYIGRGNSKCGRPFRFILNHSQAIAANVYLLLYPKPVLANALAANPALTRQVWEWLGTIQPGELLDEGRVYGGGLYKLEPNELANVGADGLQALLPVEVPARHQQHTLFDFALE